MIHTYVGILYPAKKNKLLIHTIAQMNLENIVSQNNMLLYDPVYIKCPKQTNL